MHVDTRFNVTERNMAYMSVKKQKDLIQQINVLHDTNIAYATPRCIVENEGNIWYVNCPHCKRQIFNLRKLDGSISTVQDERGKLTKCSECNGELVIG